MTPLTARLTEILEAQKVEPQDGYAHVLDIPETVEKIEEAVGELGDPMAWNAALKAAVQVVNEARADGSNDLREVRAWIEGLRRPDAAPPRERLPSVDDIAQVIFMNDTGRPNSMHLWEVGYYHKFARAVLALLGGK